MILRIIVSALCMVLAPVLCLQASIGVASGKMVRIAPGEVASDDFFAAGEAISLEGEVPSDLIAAGKRLEMMGTAGDSFVGAGQKINLTGRVGDDAYLAGEEIDISGSVGSDVVVAGRAFKLWPAGLIGGDLIVYARLVELGGQIKGNVSGASECVVINGTVGGALDLTADEIVLGPQALIKGDFAYSCGEELIASDDVRVGGKVIWTPKLTEETDERMVKAFGGGFVTRLVAFLMALLVGSLLIAVSRKHIGVIRDQLRARVAMNMLCGLVVLATVPLAILILTATVIGIPLGIFLSFGYLISLYLGSVVAAIGLGDMICERFFSRKDSFYLSLTLGAALLWLVRYIPYLGGWVVFIAVLWGCGAFVLSRWTMIKQLKAKQVI
jgi:hypothetical protein